VPTPGVLVYQINTIKDCFLPIIAEKAPELAPGRNRLVVGPPALNSELVL